LGSLLFLDKENLILVKKLVQSQEEILFDRVAQFLYDGPLEYARKEFYLILFAEWSRSNMDIILDALSSSRVEV
jgi:hypothetical protein